jgi:hypothetical protein
MAELKAKNQVKLCHSTRFVKGKEIRSIICRISGYIPPAKTGGETEGWDCVDVAMVRAHPSPSLRHIQNYRNDPAKHAAEKYQAIWIVAEFIPHLHKILPVD